MSDNNKSRKGPRKLQLLPEVLPTPRPQAGATAGRAHEKGSAAGGTAPPHSSGFGPRDRTLARLSKLMAVAAAGAVLAGCGDDKSGSAGNTAGTTAGNTASATTAEPATSATATSAGTTSAEPTASATSTGEPPDAGASASAAPDAGPAASGSAKVKPVQQQQKRDKGYHVVDMLPAPSRGEPF